MSDSRYLALWADGDLFFKVKMEEELRLLETMEAWEKRGGADFVSLELVTGGRACFRLSRIIGWAESTPEYRASDRALSRDLEAEDREDQPPEWAYS